MARLYVLKESTGRYSATIAFLTRLSKVNNLFILCEFTPEEIPTIRDELCSGVGQVIFIILGENDIVKWGPELRTQIPPSESVTHFYPTLEAACIETSKIYCRSVLAELQCGRYNPVYKVVCADDPELDAKLSNGVVNLLDWVIKCDGLASGKGVWVGGGVHYNTHAEGRDLVLSGLERGRVLLEERLVGQEFSLHSICYEGRVQHTPCVRDFKRRGSDDTGPNTGGMGTISYADGLMPFLTPDEYIECCQVNEWVSAKIDFTGVLYGSFMKTDDGSLKVIEYNCRPGDSEWINLAMLADVDIAKLTNLIGNPPPKINLDQRVWCANPKCRRYCDGSCLSGNNLLIGYDPILNDIKKRECKRDFVVDGLISCLRFRPDASVCTYIVDRDYCITSPTNMSNHLNWEEYITLDTPCEPGLCGFFPAGIELISDGTTSSNWWLGCRRHKYKYSRPGRLMAVCATSSDIDDLIDIHSGLCAMVRGTRLDWRRDIPEFLRDSDSTPISSISSTPRFSQPVIDFPDAIRQSNQFDQSYLSHLDNYNSIMDGVKLEIDNTNREISISSGGRLELTGEIGDFANSIRTMTSNGNGLTLICSVDGAGTKTKFMTEHPDRFRILGHDVIIHNINDMLCNGGTPVAFLDYYGCDRLDPQEFAAYIHGILEICRSEGIPLIGGETAEMRGIYQPEECEVLGMLLGVALNGTRNGGVGIVRNGTLIYGIKSHGAHTNGFTKLREIQSRHTMPDWVYRYFCQPHRNYRPIFEALDRVGIHPVAKAHITGGGFTDNLMRVVAADQQSVLKLELEPWELSREWEWVYMHSGLSWSEFIRVFNAGFGMCFMVNEPINRYLLPDDLAGDVHLLGAFWN
jgi:phosphoribosylaminoimidazole (AIR) synthetase